MWLNFCLIDVSLLWLVALCFVPSLAAAWQLRSFCLWELLSCSEVAVKEVKVDLWPLSVWSVGCDLLTVWGVTSSHLLRFNLWKLWANSCLGGRVKPQNQIWAVSCTRNGAPKPWQFPPWTLQSEQLVPGNASTVYWSSVPFLLCISVRLQRNSHRISRFL